jgi:ribonucleoside-triphosphate reductase
MLKHVYLKSKPLLVKRFSYKFKLNEQFIDLYKNKPANFGFNGLGQLVYRRTYSRIKEDGTNEEWFETVRRVVEGTFNLLS